MPETGNSISFDTAKTVLVPLELYEKGREEELLRFNGMALDDDETAVASAPGEGGMNGEIIAVMGIPADVPVAAEAAVTAPKRAVAEVAGRSPLCATGS